MQTITRILGVEERTKDNKRYTRTYALITDELGNIEEAVGYGSDFEVNDRVQFFHHRGVNKMRKSIDSK